MRLVLAIIITILLMQPAPTAYYVAPYGVASADGAADNPRSLAWAMTSAPAGSTVYLIPGTYVGDFRVLASSVTYRSLPGTRARIDGSLRVSASYVTVRDLEITNTSWTTRTGTTMPQIQSAFEVITPGFSVPITGVQILGNYIHDLGGVGDWSTAHASVWRNNLIANIGWRDNAGIGHGHGIYAQNEPGSVKLLQDNIFAGSYGLAMQAYGSVYAPLDSFTFDHNVFLNGRFLLGGGQTVRHAQITNNRSWNSSMTIGYSGAGGADVAITGNWIGNARLQVQAVTTPTVRLNRMVSPYDVNVYLVPPYAPASAAWDANTYYKPTAGSPFAIDQIGFYTFPTWRTKTGWDATSTFSATLPISNWIEATPTTPHHGHVIVYNWTGAPTVTVDLAPLGLTPGAAYRLINAQHVAESQVFVAGTPVSLPMTGWTVAVPIGASAPLNAWDSRFGVWLVAP